MKKTYGNRKKLAFGGEQVAEYIDIELQCCTPEIYMLLTNVTSIKK